MRKIKLDISYLGTAYCGWQVQPNKPTVQKYMQLACEKAFGTAVEMTGCSRTDSGVHAKSFICTAQMAEDANNIPNEKIPMALNVHLPNDIRVKSAREVGLDFHPRYSSVGKEYKYYFCDNPYHDPFMYGRVTFCSKLDEKAMDICAKEIIGEHDFACFMASGSKIVDTVRTVYSCSVCREGENVVLTVSANGFLYNMVRIIAGTLLLAGKGELTPKEMKDIIASKNRSNAGQTLAPCGLYLNRVFYD
ncbi:MAG: tRNA pseudouridine(38-40) synthase TruA [Clostridia bacterium]|nr:tRNA pseudouridine(38-40) synthase TruA [Clostridia bacterium]